MKFGLKHAALQGTHMLVHLFINEQKVTGEENCCSVLFSSGHKHCGIHACLIAWGSSMRLFFTLLLPNSNQSESEAKKPFCGVCYCPLDPKSWHLWMLEEGKSKMVLRSVLKKNLLSSLSVCFALPNVFWQTVCLQHYLAVKCVKESFRGCCGCKQLGGSCRGENIDCLNSC